MLTEKQKKFADEYLIDLNATRAYKAAYPNTKKDESAAVCGSKLLRNPKVREYLDEQLANLHNKRIAKVEDIMVYLSEVMFGNSEASVLAMCGDGYQEVIKKPPDEKERLKAAEMLGRRYGMWTEKLEVKNEAEDEKAKAISNIENLVKQMVPVKDDEIDA